MASPGSPRWRYDGRAPEGAGPAPGAPAPASDEQAEDIFVPAPREPVDEVPVTAGLEHSEEAPSSLPEDGLEGRVLTEDELESRVLTEDELESRVLTEDELESRVLTEDELESRVLTEDDIVLAPDAELDVDRLYEKELEAKPRLAPEEEVRRRQETVTALQEALSRTTDRLKRLSIEHLRSEMNGRLRAAVCEVVPEGATVLMAAKGDDDLLNLWGRRAWHFPRGIGGGAASFIPADHLGVISHLEWLRSQGADHLVLPATESWWVERFPQLRRHLDTHYQLLRKDAICRVYSLRGKASSETAWTSLLRKAIDRHVARRGSEPSVLDWFTGLDLRGAAQGCEVFRPPFDETCLPYLEDTIDIVLMPGGRSREEAVRVATSGVVIEVEAKQDPGRETSPARVVWTGQRGTRHLPSVSVIIPTYNRADLMETILWSLRETVPAEVDAEFVVVDDCSTDDTVAILESWRLRDPRIRVIRNDQNRGFVLSCNEGAAVASKEVLVFLNNDTVLLPGWLTPMLRLFRERPDAGAVGGRLVYPDGSLQEAGAVLYNDATGANFGHRDPRPAHPLYSYVRPVDYCSGALLATPTDLFEEIGGFDELYRPCYYEDSDYCFTVRARGRHVYLQPETTIVHLEGATGGTDIEGGAKRNQAVNRDKFRHKWAAELAARREPPSSYDRGTWHDLAVHSHRVLEASA